MNLKKILGFSFGPIGAAALGLITVPTVAWVFSPDDVGRLNVFQTTVSFFLLLSVLGLDQAYVREYHEAEDRAALFRACFAPGIILLLVLAISTLFFAKEISKLLYGIDSYWLYAVTFSAFIVSFVARFLSLILRMEERGVAFSIGQVLPKVFQLGLVLIMAMAGFNREFLQLLLISLASLALMLAFYVWSTREQWRIALNKQIDIVQFRRLMAFGAPLIFSGLAYWGLTATSTFVLRSQSSLTELAVYSVAISFAGAATIIQSIFSVVWAPTVYKWVAEGVEMKRIDAVAQQALSIVSVVIFACGSFAWITDWLLPPEYSEVKYVLLCCIVQPLLYTLSEITCVGIAITRRTVLSLIVTLAAMLVNIALSFLLVPHYGARGAAIANALAFLVFFIGRTEASAWVWRQLPRIKLYLVICSIVLLSILNVIFALALPFAFEFIWMALLIFALIIFHPQWMSLFRVMRDSWALRRADLPRLHE